MAYIGRGINNISNASILDVITFTNSPGPYNLEQGSTAFTPISAQALVISVDGVVQSPSTYTIAAATITFDSSMSSASTNNFIVHNGVGLIVEPGDGTVTTAKIEDLAVTTAKLATDAVTEVKILDANVTTSKANFISTPSGAGVISKGTSGTSDGYIQLNCDQNTHGIKLKSPPHSASQSYTLTFPITAPATDKFIQTTAAGQLSFATITEFNDDAIINDISTLALHQATNNNSSKYNLVNSNVDVYQDSTAIANLTNVARDTTGEYVSSVYSEVAAFTSDSDTVVLAHMDDTGLTDSSSNSLTVTKTSGITRSATQSKFGGYSAYSDGTTGEYWQVKPLSSSTTGGVGTGDFTLEYWYYGVMTASARQYSIGNQGTPGTGGAPAQNQVTMAGSFPSTSGSQNFYRGATDQFYSPSVTSPDNTWNHNTIMRSGTTVYQAVNGVWAGTNTTIWNGINMETDTNGGTNQNDLALFARYGSTSEIMTGYMDEMRYSKVARYTAGVTFVPNQVTADNATGSYESTAQTANASVTTISGVVTYTNATGTATLNTDIILEVSADNGSTWQAATLAAAGTFSTGVLQATTNDITVVAGTQIKYKMSFANQASATKVTRINGVSLSY